MTTTFTYPRLAFGNHLNRPYQMVNSRGAFLGSQPKDAQAKKLKGYLTFLRTMTESILPSGCPFVVGGGLIRDGFGGARPGDIDIWLPSNITTPDCDAFRQFCIDRFDDVELDARVIFRGPDAHGGMDLADATAAVEYTDVNNHWVFEINTPYGPKVNFMRSMTPWVDDSQAFFNGLMRAFDLDICMLFMAWEQGQDQTPYVIIPLHMAEWCKTSFFGERHVTRLNMVYWNKLRWDRTSERRTQGRIDKMNSKYEFNLSLDNIHLIETEDIIACPVKVSDMAVWRGYIFPMPTAAYKNEEAPDASETGSLLQTA